ncbi:MAG TPA: UDP-3-O-acyl-N-acetylglucosamine deacetylase [Syntrophorhabdaceae bacterium]|nr:UDP-3-O-acyl-N-acetylglucosamine deacetylase [Syntrophorhabdaceae bacterium]
MKKILIIDDEKNILDVLSPMLEDEGFKVFKALDGKMGISIFKKERPDVVILDIWMPEMDGIEVLREIKREGNDSIVIVISGHGTISTAVEAVKMGAFDFLEKPLTIEKILEVISRGLAGREKQKETYNELKIGISKGLNIIKQKTIGKSIVVYGVGLHSGVKTGMILLPMPEDTGIIFEHVPEGERIPAFIDYVYSIGYASSVKGKSCVVRTIEHLMATCHMYGITNLLIKVSEEVPILDGSAIELCKKIEEADIVEQKEGIESLKVEEEIILNNLPEDKYLKIEPSERFEIEYKLIHPEPIGIQEYKFIGSCNEFKTDIAPARTFGFLRDFEKLNQMGLGSGGRVNNVILLSDEGVVNTKLRFPDEFVRHKILDLIGDLYLLNRPIIGRVVAQQTGHMENIALVRELKSRFY